MIFTVLRVFLSCAAGLTGYKSTPVTSIPILKKKATQLKVICRVYVFYFKSHQKGIIFVLCLIIVRQLKRLF